MCSWRPGRGSWCLTGVGIRDVELAVAFMGKVVRMGISTYSPSWMFPLLKAPMGFAISGELVRSVGECCREVSVQPHLGRCDR